MYAVGVDVSKGKSTATVLRSKSEVVVRPFDVAHDTQGFSGLVERLRGLGGEVRVVMEHTGNFYESIALALHSAGFYVSAVNPLLIKEYGGNTLRKVKTDKADAKKIARYALDNWNERLESLWDSKSALRPTATVQIENLKRRAFADTFWHVDCVARISLNTFTERYQKWCKRHGYNFSERKAAEIHVKARTLFPLVPKSETAKLLVKEAVVQLNTISRTVEVFRAEMNRLASQLPEYETVMAMTGVGPSVGPQLMAEIGDLRRKVGIPSEF